MENVQVTPAQPNVQPLLSAISALKQAARQLDEQKTCGLSHFPKERRDDLYDQMSESMGSIWQLYEDCCEYLYEVLAG